MMARSSWSSALILCALLLALATPFAVEAKKKKPADIIAVHVKAEGHDRKHLIARKKSQSPKWADEDDEDDDDEGDRRRNLLAEEVEMKEISTSGRFTAYVAKNPEFQKQLVYIGQLGRAEVVEACKELAGGKTTFEADVNEVQTEGDLDIGDDVQKTEIDHQFGCTLTRGAKIRLHPKVQTGEVFGKIKVGEKKVEHLVDCKNGEQTCNIWQMAPPEIAKTLPDAQVSVPGQGGGRKLKFGAVLGALAPVAVQAAGSIIAPVAGAVGQKAASAISRGCFPADAMVRVASGAEVPISQLQQGDKVLAMMPNGQLEFDEVYMFGHKDAQAVSQFVVLKTEAETVIRATQDHFIHTAKATAGVPTWSDMVHTQFSQVEAGDYIFSTDLGRAVRVTEVQQQAAKGLYNPYTMSGNIVVDGTSVSAHSTLLNMDKVVGNGSNAPAVYQAMLAPVRAIYRLHPGLLRHVDSLYSENGWVDVGAVDVLRAIAQYHMNVVSA